MQVSHGIFGFHGQLKFHSRIRTRQGYDNVNRLATQTWQMGDAEYTESFTYNSSQDGSLNTHTTATGQTLTMGYDELRRLSTVSGGVYTKRYIYRDISSTKTTTQVGTLLYDLPTDVSYSYSYDAKGNISAYVSPSRGQVIYTYDDQGQLLSATGYGGYNYSYTYDAAGNILTANGHTYTYGDSVWKDLLTAYDGQSITYDASGNPTSYYNGTRWTFGWTNGRRLATATNGTTNLSYTYDADGLRTSKTVDGVKHTYLYAGGKLLRETYGNNTLDFFYDSNGTPYAISVNDTIYYYITNLQGDVMSIVDAQGAAVASYEYDPYGNVISSSGDMAAINPLRYRGYYYDTDSGLYYLQSRYYDPKIGRFINADSIIGVEDMLGNNLFAYCGNNPVNKVDYSGEDGQNIELGNGWYYRIDPQNTTTGTKRHIHIWNNKKEYIQNDDGSPHDKGRGEKGKIPKWLNNKLIEKAGWDYNGNRKSFFKETSCEHWVEGTQYTFADGTTVFRSYNPYLQTWYSVDSYEGVYFQGNISSSGASTTTQTFYLPIIGPVTFPSFSFGFGWGSLPIPLLY